MSKNIKIHLLLLSYALLVTACSSPSKKAAPASKGNSNNTTTLDVTPVSPLNRIQPTEPIITKEPVKEVVDRQYQKLDEAIKSNADDKIYEAATEILAQDPEDPKALNAVALFHYKKGRLSLAKSLLLKALGRTQSSELYTNLGVIELSLSEKKEAIQSLRKALDLKNNNAVAAANLGAIYAQEKDYNKARVALDIAIKNGVRDHRILNNFAIALTANGEFSKAQEIYKTVLKEQPSHKEVLLNYSILLIEHLAQYDEGLDTLNRLKFVGGPAESRNKIIALEKKAKAGLK